MKHLSKNTLCCLSCWCGVLFVCFTSIAIPCIVYGCNASYTQCLKWDFKDMAVVKITASSADVTECIAWVTVNKVMTCTGYRTVRYYSPVVYFDTCTFSDDSLFYTSADANAYGLRTYPPGDVFQMAISRDNPSVCQRPGGLVKNLAIVGFVFGPLAAISAVAFICSYLLYVCKKEIDTLPRWEPRVVIRGSGGARRHRRVIIDDVVASQAV